MSYKDEYHPGVKKDLKQLDKPVIREAFEVHIEKLVQNPDVGEVLHGDLEGVLSYHFSKLAKFAGVPLGFFLLLEIAHWLAHSPVGAAIANGAGSSAGKLPRPSFPRCFSGSIFSRSRQPRS